MKGLNKKGFTLIELLAVIAILAILIVIMLPNVMGMFSTGKEKAFVTQAKSIYRAAQDQYVYDQVNATGTGNTYCYDGDDPVGNMNLSSNTEVYYRATFSDRGDIIFFQVANREFYVSKITGEAVSAPDIDDVQKGTFAITCP